MSEHTEHDPRAKWHALPERINPTEWVSALDDEPVPGAIQAADAEWPIREATTYPG
ncbi:hypothetical protein [Goodfellowiella coeruleoviolacea]|uniref:Uncharacterized protein n=1 Tax=Goodfellowiella coeruleoviolacea TaxID=334858 RepID=A0AAE3GAZ7_9PSEU|nr:hypothetical protein [Goodfellowiella coeruleoviolacea]MCP2164966.1 hypothetical protein [Goodfellowiella coeruleoviolacea]